MFDHFVGLTLRVNTLSNILLAKFSTKICFEDHVVSRSQGKLNKEMTEVSSACYEARAIYGSYDRFHQFLVWILPSGGNVL